MSVAPANARAMIEVLDTYPTVNVAEPEYRRLLGDPPHHVPGERADELAAWSRRWYAEHGRPWVYLREVAVSVENATLRLDGTEFQSQKLHDHLRQAGATRAMLVAVCAGRGCEEHSRQLWSDAKPDEYFFLEMFGSSVVEQLVSTLNGRICALAEEAGLLAIAHYSPGYTGWDVAEQGKLFALITRGMKQPFPEPVEVLTSGMLRPKKTLLAVVGLTARTGAAVETPNLVPCEGCSFAPCAYRRRPYRHEISPAAPAPTPAPARDANYTVSPRALRKWAGERVRLRRHADGSVEASFRFDGTTCSNSGRPLVFDYHVALSAPEQGRRILRADCRPAPGDEGHRQMCAYLGDAEEIMRAIAVPPPLVGQPLDDIFGWARTAAPSGCYCAAESRAHKWGLALEAIHFTLAHPEIQAPDSPFPAL
jgi:hypothetical protein